MKFSKGTVKNINKKLIAGTLALTLITTGLAGCSERYTNFEYTVNEQGVYEVSGTIDYELLKNYQFVVIDNYNYDTTEFYICNVITHFQRLSSNYCSYNNVFNDKEVFNEKFSDDVRKIVFSDYVENYLYAANNIKASYTKEDVEQIYKEMKENYLNENNKQLVKGK